MLDSREDSEKKYKTLRRAGRLPEKDEIIILPGGVILVDCDLDIGIDKIARQVGSTILCG